MLLMIRESDQAKRFVQRLEAKHGKPHALAVLRARIGRAVYYMLKRKEPFDLGRFFSGVCSRGGETSSSGVTNSSDSRGVTTSSPDVTGSSSLNSGDGAGSGELPASSSGT